MYNKTNCNFTNNQNNNTMSEQEKPLSEIHLSVYEDESKDHQMVITGTGRELATLLLMAFAASEEFYGVAKAAVNTFSQHGTEITELYNK